MTAAWQYSLRVIPSWTAKDARARGLERKRYTRAIEMKRRIFGWIATLIGIVVALAVVEVTAIVWLYLEDGHYTSAEELFDRTQNTYVRDLTKGTKCRYIDTLFPHPYLAFVHHGNPPCGLPRLRPPGGGRRAAIRRADIHAFAEDSCGACRQHLGSRLRRQGNRRSIDSRPRRRNGQSEETS